MTKESDEIAHRYRRAQAHRLIRYCESLGVDPRDVTNGQVDIDLTPIESADGTIIPEREDLDAV
jgi:hypothetical protein